MTATAAPPANTTVVGSTTPRRPGTSTSNIYPRPGTSERASDDKSPVVGAGPAGEVLSYAIPALKKRREDQVGNTINIIEPLSDMCIRVIADNFASKPSFDKMPKKSIEKVTALLRTNLPLKATAPVVHDEAYWRRCSEERWRSCQTRFHGSSWKQLYLERHLNEWLEEFNPDKDDVVELLRLLEVSRNFISSVRIRQLLSHVNLSILFTELPYLTDLQLSYGVQTVGMGYKRTLFGMRPADVDTLKKHIELTPMLTQLTLTCTLLDCDAVRKLCLGLIENDTITYLDLSHNNIAERGARALGMYIAKVNKARKNVLTYLNLADNEIPPEGGRVFGQALKANKVLLSLNLRLNRLGPLGSKHLFTGLIGNSTLNTLNVSSNALDADSIHILANLLEKNSTIKDFDISSNTGIGEDGAQVLVKGLEKNAVVTSFDVRNCEIPDEIQTEILDRINENRQNEQKSARL